jgi:transcription initiation factor TFIIIB Brf1 subunit/transcription initiation factor TFIIB
LETEYGCEDGKVDFQKQIQDLVQGLNLGEEVLEKAIELMDEHRSSFRDHDEHLPPAVVHVASRLVGEPRTQKVIADYIENRDHLLGFDDRHLRERMRENVKKLRKMDDVQMSIVRSKQHLDFIASQLQNVEFSEEVLQTAENYCENVDSSYGVSRSKAAIAGCCLKQAFEEHTENRQLTHTQLAEVTSMNQKTFENNMKYLLENDLLYQQEEQ